MSHQIPPLLAETWRATAPYVPFVLGLLGILLGAWLAAVLARRLVYAALSRTDWDQRLLVRLGWDESEGEKVERAAARLVYYVVLTLGGVALLDYLNLDSVTRPIVGALEDVVGAVPNLFRAALVALVGFVAASLAARAVGAALRRTKLVERLEGFGSPRERDPSELAERSLETTRRVSRVVFWAVLLVASVPVLEALRVGVLSGPLAAMLSGVATYVPRVLGAIVLALVGWFSGRICRFVVRAAVDRLGADPWLRRNGLGKMTGSETLGGLLGSLAMAFVVLHFSISAVGQLGIREISEPLGLVLTQIYGYLPRVVVALALLAVAVLVSRLIGRATGSVLAALGLNRLLEQLGWQRFWKGEEPAPERTLTRQSGTSETAAASSRASARALFEKQNLPEAPADLVGAGVGAVVFLLFAQQVLETLNLGTLAGALEAFLVYLPNILVAGIALAFGIWAGGWLRDRLQRLTRASDDGLLRALGGVGRAVVIAISAMVALEQLGVGERIVTLAFALVLGGSTLGLALAFGLGGRGVAARWLESRYESLHATPHQGHPRGANHAADAVQP